jgi:hypothetical protein
MELLVMPVRTAVVSVSLALSGKGSRSLGASGVSMSAIRRPSRPAAM